MNRNYNYWSKKNNNSNAVNTKVETPKVKCSICTKESLVGMYSDNESNIISTQYCDDISIGCLELLESVVESIPTNEEGLCDSITIIYVPDIISALVTGGVADYIRTKKTKLGEDITEEKLNLYVNIDKLVKERSYNVILRSYSFQDQTFQAKAIAWIKDEVRNATAKAHGVERNTINVNSTTNSAIDKLNEQIVKLTIEGKFEEAQKIANILATMTNANNNEQELNIEDEDSVATIEG